MTQTGFLCDKHIHTFQGGHDQCKVCRNCESTNEWCRKKKEKKAFGLLKDWKLFGLTESYQQEQR